MNTKKTGLATILAGALLGACKEESKDVTSDLPRIESNQSMIQHPAYLMGQSGPSYTILTDMDRNGDWDVLERVRVGFTTGDFSRNLYFKKGFGPAQSLSGYTNVEFVEPDFFKPYQ